MDEHEEHMEKRIDNCYILVARAAMRADVLHRGIKEICLERPELEPALQYIQEEGAHRTSCIIRDYVMDGAQKPRD